MTMMGLSANCNVQLCPSCVHGSEMHVYIYSHVSLLMHTAQRITPLMMHDADATTCQLISHPELKIPV